MQSSLIEDFLAMVLQQTATLFEKNDVYLLFPFLMAK